MGVIRIYNELQRLKCELLRLEIASHCQLFPTFMAVQTKFNEDKSPATSSAIVRDSGANLHETCTHICTSKNIHSINSTKNGQARVIIKYN